MTTIRPTSTVLLATLVMSGCGFVSSSWERAIADRTVHDAMSLRSYRGRVVERGMVPSDPDAPVVKDVRYQRPGKVRVEVVEPASRAGDLLLLDGQNLLLWWPAESLGIRFLNTPAIGADEIRAHVRRGVNIGLRRYHYVHKSTGTTLEQPTTLWKMYPRKRRAYHLAHSAWMHQRYALPMRIEYYDAPGKIWYGMWFSELEIDVDFAGDAFAFEPPADSLIVDFDLAGPGVDLQHARSKVGFPVLLPRRLPAGHEITKVLVHEGAYPIVLLLMNRGGTWISLLESPRTDLELPIGKPVVVGGEPGYLNFAGTYATLTWATGDTQLALTANLPFVDLLEIAESL